MPVLRFLGIVFISVFCSILSNAQTCSNIAVGYPTRVSSNQGGSLGGYATDGRMDTRWESQFSDPQWLVIDLGVAHSICEVVIRWENASARDFTLELSTDSLAWTTVATVTNNEQYVNTIPVSLSARYVRLNGTARTTSFGYSIYELEVHAVAPTNCASKNLALNKPATVSSVGNPVFVKENAFDGDPSTRWESAFSDPQFISVDLGDVFSICGINLLWENAYGRDFQVQFSTDGALWQTVVHYIDNASMRNHLPVSGLARHVRILGTRRATDYGYSLFELEVFGTPGVLPAVFGNFSGTIVPGGISLEWEILQETDVSKYIIERREFSGGLFREVGSVASLGNSQAKRSYFWKDPNPAAGLNFYRVRMLDKDGSFKLSKELRVEHIADQPVLRYQPESQKIIVDKAATLRAVNLVNAAGVQQAATLQLSASGGEIRLSSVVSGIYFLQLLFSDGRREVRSIYLR